MVCAQALQVEKGENGIPLPLRLGGSHHGKGWSHCGKGRATAEKGGVGSGSARAGWQGSARPVTGPWQLQRVKKQSQAKPNHDGPSPTSPHLYESAESTHLVTTAPSRSPGEPTVWGTQWWEGSRVVSNVA